MKRFHGIDRHKLYSTISVLNREGIEVEFHPMVKDSKNYVKKLGPDDAVVLEASTYSCARIVFGVNPVKERTTRSA